ncbi:MAG: class I SAM-dependent methyltransferase [Candidatus Andersenbacteria bacterium]
MNPRDARKIIRQRTAPNLFDFSYVTTRAHLQAFRQFLVLLAKESKPMRIIDVGCGYKPFLKLLRDLAIDKYIGVDFDTKRSAADVVASADRLPFPDNSFDGVIATEVLEHTMHIEDAIREIRRVARNGALVYISTPFLLGEHGVPYDFQRLTRYWYLEMFKHDEILLLQGTNTSFAAPFFIANIVVENIAALKTLPLIPELIYVLNNVCALAGEAAVKLMRVATAFIFRRKRAWATNIMDIYFGTMPGGLDVIVRIKK